MLLLLTLPGVSFLYQGDEIGMREGPGHDPPLDRAGRDRTRHPMQWDGTPLGGFTTGAPWLPVVDAPERNVAAQSGDPDSTLALARAAIALRGELGGDARFLDAADGVLAFQRRSGHVVALNFTADPRPAPPAGELRLATHGSASGSAPAELAPYAGFVALPAR
jgi:glycosidase